MDRKPLLSFIVRTKQQNNSFHYTQESGSSQETFINSFPSFGMMGRLDGNNKGKSLPKGCAHR
ncbi:hypothetical protein [Solibaculum mannosilyticum]|uniref:hypothetical protein n=1 Tax=Solibaculum mannosilyticum TaxID=2780922 RepID=UPI0036F1C18F